MSRAHTASATAIRKSTRTGGIYASGSRKATPSTGRMTHGA